MTATAQAARTTYRSVFASRGYAALYSGSAASMLGISLQILAFSVGVFDQTRSPVWSSAAFAAGFLPQVLGGVLLPSLADRVPARVLLPIGSLVRAAAALVLASGVLPLVAGIAVVAAGALVQPLFSAGQSGLVSRLLTGDCYVLGRSLFTLTSMISQLVGLAIGGAVLQVVGIDAALLVVGVLQLLSAAVLAVGLPSLPVVRATDGRWRIGETWAAYRRILARPVLRRLLLLWWVPLALSVGAESLGVAYAGDAGASGTVTGLLLAAPPLGAFVGELVVGRLCRPVTRERLVLPMLLLLGAGLLPLALHPSPLLAAALIAVGSFGLAYELGRQAEFRDALPVGGESVGFGLLGVGMMTGQGLGPMIAGPLAAVVGPGPAIACFGVAILVSGTVLWQRAGRVTVAGRSSGRRP